MTARDPQVSDWVGLTSEGTADVPAASRTEGGVRYRVGGELGTGGMGRVRAAFDTRLEREIAVKHVRAEGDAAAEAALLREARVTAGLDHPGIIAVLDAGHDEHGAPFYAMRVVHGDSLESLVAATPDADARRHLARALLQAAQAIAYAHARGVVHRDLSPGNIRIGRHGEVVVMDWGLAARLDDAARPGVACGTPGFRAPELARGDGVGPAADVWSLGALLHLIVAGTPPGAHLTRRLPAPLRSLLARALADAPTARYPDAGAFARDLAAFLDDASIAAHRERLWERAARVARRHPGTVLASTVGIAAVAIVAIVLGTVAARRRDEARRSQAETREALRALVVPRASDAVRAERRADAEELAASARELGDSAAARGVEAAFAASARITTRELGSEDGCRTLDVSDGGARLCTRGSELWLVERAARHRIEAGTVEPYAARFLDDGGLLVVADRVYRFAADRRLVATHAVTGGLPQVDESDAFAYVAVPDMYLAIAPDGTARTLTPCTSGVAIRLIAAIPSPDGASVALCADGALVFDRSAPGYLAARAVFTPLPAPSSAAVIGTLLVLGGADGKIGALDFMTGDVQHAAAGPLGTITRIESTPWGDAIVVGSEGVGLWRPSSGAWRHIEPRARVTDATATANEVIAFGAGSLHAWSRASSDAVNVVHTVGGLSAIAWSPEGNRVAFGGGDGFLHLVGVNTGDVFRRPLAKQVIKSLAFSPAGGSIALGIADDAGVLEVSASTLAPKLQPDVERAMRARRIAYLTADLLVAFTYHAQPSAYDLASHERVPITPMSAAIVDIATSAAVGTIYAIDAHGDLWRYRASRSHDALRAVPRAVALGVSADGGTLAAITSSGTLEVRDAATDVTRATLSLPGADVTTLSLSPSGDRVALGRLDGAVEVWTLSPLQRELVVHAHTGRVAAVAFAPNGCKLATAGWDAVGRVLALCDHEAQRASSVQPVPAASQSARGDKL